MAFDAVLAEILVQDPLGVVVITYSRSQVAWQALLERRLTAVVDRALSRALNASPHVTEDYEGAGKSESSCEGNNEGGSETTKDERKGSQVRRRGWGGSSRVRFLPTLPHDDFLRLLRAAAVVLDPFPFGGGVTTLEAFAVGTPVVTLPVTNLNPLGCFNV